MTREPKMGNPASYNPKLAETQDEAAFRSFALSLKNELNVDLNLKLEGLNESFKKADNDDSERIRRLIEIVRVELAERKLEEK